MDFNYLLQYTPYALSAHDRSAIQEDIVAWITGKLLRKRFRKTKIHASMYDDISQKIQLAVDANEPIYLIIIFGGYKHFWNDSYPHVDWAELFNLGCMSELLAPILAAYKPGVILDYASEDVIISKMNNYPPSSLDAYAVSFGTLISEYSQNIPDNFRINYVRTGEKYDTAELLAKIDAQLPKSKQEWSNISSEEKEARLLRSNRSVMFDGMVDYSDLDSIQKHAIIEESKQIEDLFYEIEDELIDGYYYTGTHIPVVLSWGLSGENVFHWLTLGSTRASSVDFWIGRGVLEKREDRYIPRVVSQTQYAKIQPALTCCPGIKNIGDNFLHIEVFEGEGLIFGDT